MGEHLSGRQGGGESMSPKRTAATAPVLRRITAEAVLQALVSGDELTAGDLMSATGLSRPTVHSVCDELIGRGWVTETGAAPAPASVGERTAIQVAASTGGRPSRRYALNAGAGLVAGIDLGATKISCCLADLRGRIVVETTEPWRDEHVGAPGAGHDCPADHEGAARRSRRGSRPGAGRGDGRSGPGHRRRPCGGP